MRLCIPTLDDRGLEGTPSDHFGSAPFFTFIDTETGELETTRNGGAHHVHGACRPLDFLGARTVDAVICRGLGQRAFARLSAGGVQIYVTLEADVTRTLEAFKGGRLRARTSQEACHGHGHSHGDGPGEHGHETHGHGVHGFHAHGSFGGMNHGRS